MKKLAIIALGLSLSFGATAATLTKSTGGDGKTEQKACCKKGGKGCCKKGEASKDASKKEDSKKSN